MPIQSIISGISIKGRPIPLRGWPIPPGPLPHPLHLPAVDSPVACLVRVYTPPTPPCHPAFVGSRVADVRHGEVWAGGSACYVN